MSCSPVSLRPIMMGIMNGVNTITANNENNMSKNLVTYSLSFSISLLQNHNQKAIATPYNTIWYCESAAAMTFISPREIFSSAEIIEFLYTMISINGYYTSIWHKNTAWGRNVGKPGTYVPSFPMN